MISERQSEDGPPAGNERFVPVAESGVFLFVGGPFDGQRIPVAHSDSSVKLPVEGHNTIEYRPIFFRITPEREHMVYALADLTADDVLERLIEAYGS